VFGQAVTFTATVTANVPGSGTPTGTVTFQDGFTILATLTLDSSGKARYTTAGLAVGSHSLVIVYSGDSRFTASTSVPLNQTVSRDATSSAVTSSVNPSAPSQAVTFTATVTASAPGAGTPTGTVTFLDGTTVLGTASLGSSGQASLTISRPAIGSHLISVTYNGDAHFLTSHSASLTQGVGATGPTIHQGAAVLGPISSGDPFNAAMGYDGPPHPVNLEDTKTNRAAT
jgi:hypothetical protein